MNDNKGFTTVELILAIVIAGIIMGAVASFLVFSLNSYNATEDVINTQYEGQLALNQFVNIARESTGIDEITADVSGSEVSQLTNAATITPVTVIMTLMERDTGTGHDYSHKYTIVYDETAATLTCSIDYDAADTSNTDVTYLMADNITSFRLEPGIGPGGTTHSFALTNDVEITMKVQDGDAYLDLSSHVRFRNKR